MIQPNNQYPLFVLDNVALESGSPITYDIRITDPRYTTCEMDADIARYYDCIDTEFNDLANLYFVKDKNTDDIKIYSIYGESITCSSPNLNINSIADPFNENPSFTSLNRLYAATYLHIKHNLEKDMFQYL